MLCNDICRRPGVQSWRFLLAPCCSSAPCVSYSRTVVPSKTKWLLYGPALSAQSRSCRIRREENRKSESLLNGFSLSCFFLACLLDAAGFTQWQLQRPSYSSSSPGGTLKPGKALLIQHSPGCRVIKPLFSRAISQHHCQS